MALETGMEAHPVDRWEDVDRRLAITRTSEVRKRIGVALFAVGQLLLLLLNLTSNREIESIRDAGGLRALLAIDLFPALVSILGAFLYWRGRQYGAQAAAETVLSDSNPDIMYLRSFRSDPSTWRMILSSLRGESLMAGLTTEEEQLAEVLRPFGDLVAVGKPGEVLPIPGAARMYTSDNEWKEVVAREMRKARFVVLRAGTGDNLLWELEQAVATVDPQRILILVLDMKTKDYLEFCARARPVVGMPLPRVEKIHRDCLVSGLIRFTADRESVFYSLDGPWFRISVFKPYRCLFKYALKPLYLEAGLPWSPPRVSLFRIVVAAARLALIGLVLTLFLSFIVGMVLNALLP